MNLAIILISNIISATSVTIAEPVDGETYNGDWLMLSAIVENDNELPDSVSYSLNGQPRIQILRLDTDWYTYMGNYYHTGYSESPAPADNTILWTARVTGDSHEFPTPVVVDGIVYYPSNSGTDSLYALDSATGDLIWKYRVGETDDAVTVKDGFLYIASDSVWCLDAYSGDRIWASSEGNVVGGTPVAVDGRVYCGWEPFGSSPDTCNVVCLDASDGSNVWTETLYNANMVSCMTVWTDLLIVPTYLEPTGSPLYALNRETGEIVWENTDAQWGYWDSSPVIVDSTIYINDLWDARAVNALTGETEWVSEYYGSTATPAYHNERLYYGNANNYFCLNAINGDDIWFTDGCQHGSSAVADGMVFHGNDLSDAGGIRALDCSTGAEIWSYYPPETYFIAGSPSVVDGVVYMPMHDWNLYAFGTGLKYTYREDYFYADIGSNQLIVTSWDNGTAVAADTINFTVTQTGISLEPFGRMRLSAEPNPFFGNTSISFELAESGAVSLQIYDLTGRLVADLGDSNAEGGLNTIHWNGVGDNGQPLSSGLYLCRIQYENVVETLGLCLLK